MIEQLLTLPIEQKIGQLFFVGIPGPSLDVLTRALLDEVSPGGICLFARNIREPRQTRDLLDGIRDYLPVAPLLSLDQEGGLVDRLRRLMTPMPAPSKVRNASGAAQMASIIGETVRILGFNMDFAPVVDVIDEERSKYSNGLISRTFGKSKEDATIFAGEFLHALQANGIVGCLKHFPGLAAARVDSHAELPVVDISESELFETDLFPYRELLAKSDVHAIMAAHASFPNLGLQETGQNGKLLPSSLSYNFITTLLREELGYAGLVLTDDLEMGAIINNYGIGEACKMAILAGHNMLSICADPAHIREGLAAVRQAFADGEITVARIDESLRRIAAMKSRMSDPLPFNTFRLESLSGEIAEFNDQLDRN